MLRISTDSWIKANRPAYDFVSTSEAPTTGAACAGVLDPEVFFPMDHSMTPQAQEMCGRCPVVAACAKEGENMLTGTWGGKSAIQRYMENPDKQRYDDVESAERAQVVRAITLSTERAQAREQDESLAREITEALAGLSAAEALMVSRTFTPRIAKARRGVPGGTCARNAIVDTCHTAGATATQIAEILKGVACATAVFDRVTPRTPRTKKK